MERVLSSSRVTALGAGLVGSATVAWLAATGCHIQVLDVDSGNAIVLLGGPLDATHR